MPEKDHQSLKIFGKSSIINNLWNDTKMIKTFPNIKIEDSNKNVIYIDSLLPDIKPYYIKVFENN